MNLFISYSHEDRAAVDILAADLASVGHDVWLDTDLDGGQIWWDTILTHLRGADVCILALSPNWIDSDVCIQELEYARSLHRNLLPVTVLPTNPALLPPELQVQNVIDYTSQSKEQMGKVLKALGQMERAPELPSPLPDPPVIPESLFFKISRLLKSADYLDPPRQFEVLGILRSYVMKPKLSQDATTLLVEFRQRSDITAEILPQVDALLKWPIQNGEKHEGALEHRIGDDDLPPVRPKRRNRILRFYDAPWYRDWAFLLTFGSIILGLIIGTWAGFVPHRKTIALPFWLVGLFWGFGIAFVGGFVPAGIRLRLRRRRARRVTS